MRAVRVDRATGGLAVVDVPRSRPAAGEVLIRVGAAAIGAVDLGVVRGELDPVVPARDHVVPGHEVAGHVAAPGAGVDGWPLNRRVAIHPVLESAHGDRLLGLDRDGGWAAYVTAPASALVPLPPRVGLAEAAVLTSTVATPWSALTGPAGPRPGESLAVWGVGESGLHAVALARLVGVAPLIAVDPRTDRRARATAAGADVVLDPGSAVFDEEWSRALPDGVDVALDESGLPETVRRALMGLGRNGRFLALSTPGSGLQLDRRAGRVRSRQVVEHVGSSAADLATLVRLVDLGRIDLSGSVGPVVPLEQVAEAVATAETAAGRIVLEPEPAPSRY